MIITEQEQAFLHNSLGIVVNDSMNVNDILLPLDEWIALNGFDDVYNLTNEGRKAQRIYDAIYERNVL